jgi:alpha-amylase/alpha-mannosidase (GH57 family)
MADVFVSFLWHHHQPYYREGPGGRYAMPWVRLHGIKGYYGMAWLAQQHPGVHLTFNLVPSLMRQLDDYAHGRAEDEHLRLTVKPAAELTPNELHFVLDEFFSANWDTMIRPHDRYGELLRQRRFERLTAPAAVKDFTTQDLRDLQVWATLAWFFPGLHRADPVVRELVTKGRGYTEDDKAAMLARQQDILAQVLPLYRGLQEQGRVEISLSPFYHPILPLLCDMTRAREALPSLPLPRERTDLSADARAQVVRAVETYRAYFGRPPRGMWPPEGSVSPEVVELAADAGLRWMATDEGILARSLGRAIERDAHGDVTNPELLYQPYRVAGRHGDVAVVFRDRVLSDRIGFHYYHRPPEEAAADLVERLRQIGARCARRAAFVAIILDGENPWEHYRDGGLGFLNGLYRRLAATPGLRTMTVSEYLEAHPLTATLSRLFSGSWINSDFGVWIGHEEDLRAWEALAVTRRFLAERTDGKPQDAAASAAWDELYAAEGSDWFWWYGEDRSSPQDAEFDRLFRLHLQNVYRLLGEAPPDSLDEPIARLPGREPYTTPSGFMTLRLDGRRGSFFKWLPAGVYERDLDVGVMDKQTADLIRRVYFGFSESDLYLRVDTSTRFVVDAPPRGRLVFAFTSPREVALEVTELTSPRPVVHVQGQASEGALAAADDVLEVACPFRELSFRSHDGVRFTVRLFDGDELVERAPRAGVIAFEVPTPDFEHELWHV